MNPHPQATSSLKTSDQRRDLDYATIIRSIHHKVPAPDVVFVPCYKAYTRSIMQPQTTSFRLFLWHFETSARVFVANGKDAATSLRQKSTFEGISGRISGTH